jgi:hypothetical protein
MDMQHAGCCVTLTEASCVLLFLCVPQISVRNQLLVANDW